MTADSPSQPDLLDEIVAGYLLAIESGVNPSRDELLARYPALVDELREFFADHDRMNRLAQPLCEKTLAHPVIAAAERIRYFGDYEVLEEIARGGMGVVFKARQVTLNRIVAIKMILSGQLASPADVERFHTEAEAAAKLDHPGIVPVYEVGLHEGQHYFSMGFVDGQSLSARIANGPLPPREAAQIVRTVAEAVQYAHENGVIHRDLKPGNILLDRQGNPRITDFGLAKLTESHSDLTGTGQILGTPGYMPPEQAAAHLGAVGPLSDIYSLGAILYCLLTGRPPFQAATPVETLLQVQRQEPVPPRQLNPAIPLDLNTIVLKCLDKSPGRRYATAQDIAAELDRFLDGRPIVARPIGSIERLARWCRRKPAVAALSAACVAATVITIAVLVISRAAVNSALSDRIIAYSNLEAEQQKTLRALEGKTTALKLLEVEEQKVRDALRDKTAALEAEAQQRAEVERQQQLVEGQRDRALAAERQAKVEEQHAKQSQADTQAFSEFLVRDILAVARPEGVQGGLGLGVTVAQALDAAEGKLEGRFVGRPLAEATARDAIGKTFRNLDKFAQAERHLRRTVEIRERELGPNAELTLDSRNSLAVVLNQMGRHAEAIALHEVTLERRKVEFGADHQETLICMGNLGEAYRSIGKLDLALPLLEQTLEMMQAKFGRDHSSTLRCMSNLALAYQAVGKVDKALPLLQETLEKRTAEFGPDHPSTLSTMNSLASAYQTAGKLALALPLYEQTLKRQTATLGPEHLQTLISTNNLAFAYEAAGRRDEALLLHEQTLEKLKSKLGADHLYTIGSMFNLASAYQAAGRLGEAEPLFREAAAGSRRLLGIGHSQTQFCLHSLGGCYEGLRQPEKGEPVWRELTAYWKAQAGADSEKYAGELAALGLNLLQQRKAAAGEPILRECLLILEKTQSDAWVTAYAKSLLGGSLLGQNQYAEAEALLVVGYEGMKERQVRIPGTDSTGSPYRIRLIQAVDRLIQLAEATNKTDDLKKWQEERAKLSKIEAPKSPPVKK